MAISYSSFRIQLKYHFLKENFLNTTFLVHVLSQITHYCSYHKLYLYFFDYLLNIIILSSYKLYEDKNQVFSYIIHNPYLIVVIICNMHKYQIIMTYTWN